MFAYDLRWAIDPAIVRHFEAPPPPAVADVRVVPARREDCELKGEGASAVIWSGTADEPVTLERGERGDYRLTYGDDAALFHISRPRDEIRCHARDPSDPGWQRALFDTVMFCTALLRGRHMLHAAAVSMDGQTVAIAGLTGGGKSTLAWEMLRGGASLVSDDVTTLTVSGSTVVAAPGPPLMNLPAERELEGLATEIANFPQSDERWVYVAGTQTHPQRLAAVVLLDRRPGREPSFERLAPSPLDLLPHCVHLDSTDAGVAGRFERMSDLVDRVPIYRLVADLTEPPANLRERLTARLKREGLLAGPRP